VTPEETLLIDRSIKAYKNTIKFLKDQILDLERKKLIIYDKDCPECFKIIKKKEK